MQDAAAAAGRDDAAAVPDPDSDGPPSDLWSRRAAFGDAYGRRRRRHRGATRSAPELTRTAHGRPPPGAPPWPWPWNGGTRRPAASPRIFPAMKAFLQFLMLNTCYQSGKKPGGIYMSCS